MNIVLILSFANITITNLKEYTQKKEFFTEVYTSDPVSTPVELYDGRVAEHHKGILATLFSPIKWLIDLILLPFRTIMHFFHL